MIRLIGSGMPLPEEADALRAAAGDGSERSDRPKAAQLDAWRLRMPPR